MLLVTQQELRSLLVTDGPEKISGTSVNSKQTTPFLNPPCASTPTFHRSCSPWAHLPCRVCRPSPFGLYQARNLTRTRATAAPPTQPQMFSLVLRLNIQERGTKTNSTGMGWIWWWQFQSTSTVSGRGTIILYTHTDDFIRLTCLTQTNLIS